MQEQTSCQHLHCSSFETVSNVWPAHTRMYYTNSLFLMIIYIYKHTHTHSSLCICLICTIKQAQPLIEIEMGQFKELQGNVNMKHTAVTESPPPSARSSPRGYILTDNKHVQCFLRIRSCCGSGGKGIPRNNYPICFFFLIYIYL